MTSTIAQNPITVTLSPKQVDYLKKLIDEDMNTLRDLLVEDAPHWNDDFQLAKKTLEVIGG